MTAIPTPFGSSGNRYRFMGDATLINCYSEIRTEMDKARYVIVPSEGMVEFDETTDTPCRGLIYLEDSDIIHTVHSGGVWKVTSAAVGTRLGTIPGIDRAQLCRNKKATPQTVILVDTGMYIVESDVVTQISDSDLPSTAIVSIDEQGGYIIAAHSDGRFFISSLNEATEWDALDFATAEQSADKLVRVKALGDDILLMGQFTTERWRNTGNADFPFEPIGGSTMRKGVLAAHSVCDFDNSIAWVGLSREGDRAVYRLEGYQPLKISTPEIDRLIVAETSPENIIGFSFSIEGHAFYVIAGDSFTAGYDASTKQWHHRKSYQQSWWRANAAVNAWNKIIVGDRLSGSLHYLSTSTHTEDDEHQVMEIRFPHLHIFPNGGILDAMHLDFLTGKGATLSTADGFDPYLMFSISKDGGHSYGHERLLHLGRRGNYQKRVTTRRLGKCGPLGALCRLTMSDPIGRGLALADAKVRPLNRL